MFWTNPLLLVIFIRPSIWTLPVFTVKGHLVRVVREKVHIWCIHIRLILLYMYLASWPTQGSGSTRLIHTLKLQPKGVVVMLHVSHAQWCSSVQLLPVCVYKAPTSAAWLITILCFAGRLSSEEAGEQAVALKCLIQFACRYIVWGGGEPGINYVLIPSHFFSLLILNTLCNGHTIESKLVCWTVINYLVTNGLHKWLVWWCSLIQYYCPTHSSLPQCGERRPCRHFLHSG